MTMIGPKLSKHSFPLYLLTALLILSLSFPSAACAYLARSESITISGYGIAGSQPQYRSIPAALPSLPVYSFSGSSYGTARSGNPGYYSSIPAVPPLRPVNPPAPPKPPLQPEDPAPPKPPVKPEIPPAGEETANLNPQEQQLYNLVNSERASRGLAPLQLDARLTSLARLKSRDMIDLNYFAHESPTYGSTGDLFKAAGIGFSLAAENIGKGGSIKAIFDAFMSSSGHRNKIVDARYTRTGVGVIYQPGRGYLVTQLFLQPR